MVDGRRHSPDVLSLVAPTTRPHRRRSTAFCLACGLRSRATEGCGRLDEEKDTNAYENHGVASPASIASISTS
jgi:hypothetical protein